MPYLSPLGGFAWFGLGFAYGRCIVGVSRQPEVADGLRGVLMHSLAFMEALTFYG